MVNNINIYVLNNINILVAYNNEYFLCMHATIQHRFRCSFLQLCQILASQSSTIQEKNANHIRQGFVIQSDNDICISLLSMFYWLELNRGPPLTRGFRKIFSGKQKRKEETGFDDHKNTIIGGRQKTVIQLIRS